MDVLRIAMHRESWQCLAEDESPKCVADTSQILPELSKASRPAAAKMAGTWKVFDVTAVPVPDETAIGVPQASGPFCPDLFGIHSRPVAALLCSTPCPCVTGSISRWEYPMAGL